jgi:hypothetical protein
MRRVPLVDVCLMAKSLGIADISTFLAAAPDPPLQSAVDKAIRELQALGALTPEQQLTSLGRLLALLPGTVSGVCGGGGVWPWHLNRIIQDLIPLGWLLARCQIDGLRPCGKGRGVLGLDT